MTPRHVARLREADAAYLAGLIDGEGTIALSRRHSGEKRQLVVSISSTEIALVEWARHTPGVGKVTRKKTSRPHHAPGLTFSVANRQALGVLEQILPYLRSYKKRRADLVVAKYLRVTPRNGKYSVELLEARRRFEEEFAAISVRSRSLEK